MRNSLTFALLLVAGCGTSFADATLYMGSAGNQVLGIVQTTGAVAGSVNVIGTTYNLSGIAGAGSFLFTQDTSTHTINKINPAGAFISSFTSNSSTSGCCGESLFYDGTNLWRVHYSDVVEKLDATTGNVITSYPQSFKVGITSVNGTLWLSDWATGDVGPWNPTTNTFTPAFNLDTEVGALAYDSGSNILWIGFGSGAVIPYTVTGTQLNAGFVPFGNAADEIDGMTVFTSSGTPPPATPAPSSLVLVLLGLGALGVFTAIATRRARA